MKKNQFHPFHFWSAPAIVLACMMGAFAHSSSASEFGLDVYGLSYHPIRHDETGARFHERNPGLGINYIFRDLQKSQLFLDGGFFRDSYANPAKYLSIGGKYKLTRGLSIGAGLTYLRSESYNGGSPAIAPIPVLSYRLSYVTLSTLYFPKYKDRNIYSAYALFATVHFMSPHPNATYVKLK